jgi:hypothetical protein
MDRRAFYRMAPLTDFARAEFIYGAWISFFFVISRFSLLSLRNNFGGISTCLSRLLIYCVARGRLVVKRAKDHKTEPINDF